MRWLRLAGLLLLLASCGLPGNVVVLMPDDDGRVGKAVVVNDAGTAGLDQPLAAVGLRAGSSPGRPFAAKQEELRAVFAGALAGTPRPPTLYIIYFVTDEVVVYSGSRAALAAAIDAAKATPGVDVSTVGHTDTTGTDPGNLALSRRRAETIRDALVAAGIDPAVIEVSYHGANNPRVPTPPGVRELRNRRVEITIR